MGAGTLSPGWDRGASSWACQRRSHQLCLEIQKACLEEVVFELGPVLPARQKEEHGQSREAFGRMTRGEREAGTAFLMGLSW